MRKRLPSRLIGFILIGLLVIGSVAAFVWSETVQQAQPKVFYDAIRTSMTSDGVTCEISKQDVTSGSSQRISLDLASRTDARSVTTLTQPNAKVVTEGLATKSDDYIQYTDIQAPKNAAGKSPDFSRVLRVWGKQTRAELGGTSLFDQAAFGGCVVPLADLPKDKADTLMAEVEQGQIFKTNLENAKRTRFEGRPVYAYEVILTGPVYIKFVKKVTKAYGIQSLEKIDEEAYAQRTPEKLTFLINRNTHRLERIVYADQKQTVTFRDYGKRPRITVPKDTISTVELQKRLESGR